jgi:formylglycine-generating enzyme required for sulfatase activity
MKKLSVIILLGIVLFSSFRIERKQRPRLPAEFAWVPSGSYTMDSAVISTGAFYISKFEITNAQYRQFVSETGDQFICDSSAWTTVISNAGPLIKYYFRHPSYDNYPVVNVSHEAAIAYCSWLQRKIQQDNPNLEIKVMLPSRNEWIYAAMGGRSQAMFPWMNYYLRNKKGEPMCNFRILNDYAVYRNRNTGKPEIAERGMSDDHFTATVKSFTPNDYGLYNMCGNAAEMISEKGMAMGGSWNDYGGDVQIRAYAKYEKASPTIGFRPIIIIKERN